MPIYEYICDQCNAEFDALRSFKDADTPIECKKCKNQSAHRKLSTFFAHSGGRALSGAGASCSGNCSGGCSGGCGHCSH